MSLKTTSSNISTAPLSHSNMPGIVKQINLPTKRVLDNSSVVLHINGIRDDPVSIESTSLTEKAASVPSTTSSNIVKDRMKEPVEQRLQPLPVDSYRQQLLSEFEKHDTCIVIAETGSGKTTRIPQFVIEHGLARLSGLDDDDKQQYKQIIVTQPRRIAAITVAERVSQEMGCILGEEVGYCVRFDEMYSRKTKIIYMTDGMLLRKMRDDPNLSRCGMLIIDEVHERSVNTDILLGCARCIQKRRRRKPSNTKSQTTSESGEETTTDRIQNSRPTSPLKLVLMSATMDVDNFKDYFTGCRVLYLEGRQFPVEVKFLSPREEHATEGKSTPAAKIVAIGDNKTPTRFALMNGTAGDSNHDVESAVDDDDDDYFHKTLTAIFQIHLEFSNDGDILVFLTGADEINAMCKRCRSIAHQMSTHFPDAAPVQFKELYASLPKDRQEELFQPRKSPLLGSATTPNKSKFARRVILSTNVAETSVTIPNIKYVIDTGKAKIRHRISDTGVERLSIVDISRAGAMQRAGRSGRQQPGFCFRLFSQANYDRRDLYTKPEILRCNLSPVVMQMLTLKLRSVAKFSFLDRPSDESFEQAFRELWWLGAIRQLNAENDDECEGSFSSLSVTSKSSSSSRSSSNTARQQPQEQKAEPISPPLASADSCASLFNMRMRLKWSLSTFGKRMAALPVEPRYAACIVHSLQLQCTEEIIVIIAMLSAESNIFLADDIRGGGDDPRAQQQNVNDEFHCEAGDLTSMLKVWRAYCRQKPAQRKDWCYDKRINPHSMSSAARIRDQLRQVVWHSLPELQQKSEQIILPHSDDQVIVRRCLCRGLFMNAAMLNQQAGAKSASGSRAALYETFDRRYTTIKIHPSSVLAPHSRGRRSGGGGDSNRAPPKCIVFVELVQSNELYARNCVVAEEKWLEEDEKCVGYYRECRDIMLTNSSGIEVKRDV